MTVTLTFTPEGTAHGLYTEVIDLLALGILHVERATMIEFDNVAQVWRVQDVSGHPLFAADSRAKCLTWERLHVAP